MCRWLPTFVGFLIFSLPVAAQAQSPTEGPLDERLEALSDGVVGPANSEAAALGYIEAEDWRTLPPLNYIPPPYHREVLDGVRICLDPGHGGDAEQRGYKRGRTGFRESVMNLEVGLMLRDYLQASGAEVVMTRTTDNETPENGSLGWRARLADQTDSDFFISLHHNATGRRDANYVSVWYHSRPDNPRCAVDLARWIVTEMHETMRHHEPQHAGLYSSWLMYGDDATDNGRRSAERFRQDTMEPLPSGFGVLRQAQVPAILIEGAFFTHPEEEQRLMDREYLRREAWAIYSGILNYLWAGVPSIAFHEEQPTTMSDPRPEIRLTLDDGMHEGWARNDPPRIHNDTLRVYIDEERALLRYRPDLAEIIAIPREDLAPGEHTVRLRVLNVWGNWSWPTQLTFTVE
jgi:N-acetylmuramoyl-L-alanine amidase